MQDLIELATRVAKVWTSKTLEDLRVEAERGDSGISFDSIRADNGRRFMVVLCVADIDQIARLETGLDLIDDNATEDWNTLTLATLAMRAASNGGSLRFESQRDEFGRRSALALIAADPHSISLLENIFEMPK